MTTCVSNIILINFANSELNKITDWFFDNDLMLNSNKTDVVNIYKEETLQLLKQNEIF